MKFICSNCRAIVDVEPVHNEEQEKKGQKVRDDYERQESEYNEIVSLCSEAEQEWWIQTHRNRWTTFWHNEFAISDKPFKSFLRRRYPKLIELIEQGKIKLFGYCKSLLPLYLELHPEPINGGELWNYSYFCPNCGCRSKYWGVPSIEESMSRQWPTGKPKKQPGD